MSSRTTPDDSTPASSNTSTMRNRSRYLGPGTLTRTAIIDYPRKPLQWLSLLTPTMYQLSAQPSSYSPNTSTSKKCSKPTDTPHVPTATASATPPNLLPKNTPHTPILHLIILVQAIGARTTPAEEEATPSRAQTTVRLRPPSAPTVVTTRISWPGNVGLAQSRLLDPRPPPHQKSTPTLILPRQ